jgi:hypothetical protein
MPHLATVEHRKIRVVIIDRDGARHRKHTTSFLS